MFNTDLGAGALLKDILLQYVIKKTPFQVSFLGTSFSSTLGCPPKALPQLWPLLLWLRRACLFVRLSVLPRRIELLGQALSGCGPTAAGRRAE